MCNAEVSFWLLSNIPAFHFSSVFLLSLVTGEPGYQRLSSALPSCGQDEHLLQLCRIR